MPSPDQHRSELTRLKKEEATLRKQLSDAQTDAAKATAGARDKREKANGTSSASMARSYLRDAERLEKKAADHSKKAANASKKLSDNSTRQATKEKSIASAERGVQRQRDQEDERRRQREKRHAKDIARLTSPTVRHIHEVRTIDPPKPEKLRVLYLAANPEMDLRVDVEVRNVRESVKKALHRDLVEIDHRPAATPDDLLDGINEQRPHVVHFSGHGGPGVVLFDDAEVGREESDPVGRPVDFELLARALSATDTPPTMVVLNACESLDGAEVLLAASPVVVAMSDSIRDAAATVFATSFYGAIASAQSVGAAIEQGSFAVDAAGLDEGWKPEALVREDVELDELVLVRAVS